jgi:predicted CopG family antitoxin
MEQVLERIAVALEKLVGGPGQEVVPVVLAQTDKPEPKKEKVKKDKPAKAESNSLFDEEEPKEAKLVVSEESVREVIKRFAEAKEGNVEIAMAMLQKQFKVKKLREIKPEQYAEVVEVFTEALNG